MIIGNAMNGAALAAERRAVRARRAEIEALLALGATFSARRGAPCGPSCAPR
jgi:ABC-type iron transport system FetAB permease component